MNNSPDRRRVILVTGLSGGGRTSILRALEDLGYEAVDNAPLAMLEEVVHRSEGRLAVGVDARTRGFDADRLVETVRRLRATPSLRPELVFAFASDDTLLRRFTETRRRHPLSPQGRVIDGITAEKALMGELRGHADLVLDTSDLPLAELRRVVEQRFGNTDDGDEPRMVVSLVSFAYREGLPPEADIVIDARFLRNPHYDPVLRPKTGLDPEVGAYISTDPDFSAFFTRVTELLDLVLPRFVHEGKRYATITVGCTGGQHRSVYLIERLAKYLAARAAEPPAGHAPVGWRLHVTHRELVQEGQLHVNRSESPASGRDASEHGEATRRSPVQAQEA